MPVFGHLLDSPRTTYLAAFASLVLGLFFTFVWAPHPWTWAGIDQYHDLARALARGEGFNTTDVPWGYAYYVAFCYRLFGEHPWLPIVGQVLANATLPIMLHAIVRPLAGQRTATLAALITGVFSFNTVYASTQMSDALCSVLFLAAVLCFFRAHASGSLAWFAASGLLAGLSAQFRPNLLLLPGLTAVVYAGFAIIRLKADTTGTLRKAAVFLACSLLAVAPWVVRNYRLAGVFLPTSSHGAVQLWYGSLQVGPFLENRTRNPRAIFEQSPFDYTSLTGVPIIVSVDAAACAAPEREQIALTYWTDRQPGPVRLIAVDARTGTLEFRIPGQPDGTTVRWRVEPSPAGAQPGVYTVSTDHLGDLDRDNAFEDIFDVIRATAEPELRLADGSRVVIPRPWSGRITDLEAEGDAARALLMARRPRASGPLATGPECTAGQVRLNDVFYRRELHMMQRYTALALDNIRREPVAFALASAYRAVRLFVIRPASEESGATYRYAGASLIYTAGLVLSAGYLLVFLAGVGIAWRQRSPLLALLLPIVYVPATICFVLTNQRYTVTMQPLMFSLVALAIVSWWDGRRQAEG